MKQALYNYLLSELYPCPTCDTCQYSDPKFKRVPCDRCDGWNRYKLHKGHEADAKNIVRGIMKIIKANSEKSTKSFAE